MCFVFVCDLFRFLQLEFSSLTAATCCLQCAHFHSQKLCIFYSLLKVMCAFFYTCFFFFFCVLFIVVTPQSLFNDSLSLSRSVFFFGFFCWINNSMMKQAERVSENVQRVQWFKIHIEYTMWWCTEEEREKERKKAGIVVFTREEKQLCAPREEYDKFSPKINNTNDDEIRCEQWVRVVHCCYATPHLTFSSFLPFFGIENIFKIHMRTDGMYNNMQWSMS